VLLAALAQAKNASSATVTPSSATLPCCSACRCPQCDSPQFAAPRKGDIEQPVSNTAISNRQYELRDALRVRAAANLAESEHTLHPLQDGKGCPTDTRWRAFPCPRLRSQYDHTEILRRLAGQSACVTLPQPSRALSGLPVASDR